MPSNASLITVAGTSSTSGQSMWSGGPSFTLSYFNSVSTGNLGGTSANLGPGAGCAIVCGGYDVYVSAKASMGVDFGFKLDSGSVAAAVPVSVDLGTPNGPITQGTSFDITAGGFGFGNGSLQTTGTSAQAYSDFTYSLSAGIHGEVCDLVSCPGFGSSTNIVNSSGSQELLGLNRNNDGQLRVVGQTFGFGQPLPIGNFGTATANFPHGPDTSGGGTTTLTSSGSTNLASLDINAANVATDLLGLPPLSADFSEAGFDLSYNLLSADAILGLNLTQMFTFAPSPSLFLDVLETNQIVPLSANGTDSILFPQGFSELHIQPVIKLGGLLTNDTGLCIDPSLSLTALGGSLSFLGLGIGKVGPLASYSHDFGCFGGTVYGTSFNLGGFNEIDGAAFVVEGVPGPSGVPEPAAWSLIALGLVAITLMKRGLLVNSIKSLWRL